MNKGGAKTERRYPGPRWGNVIGNVGPRKDCIVHTYGFLKN